MSKENLFVLKQTSSLGDLLIKPVEKELARQMVIEHHYSHKWNFGGFGVFNFGIFRADEPDKCLGVAVYGYMKNPTAKIFHHPNPKAWICELNRLWIDDCLGKNAETVLNDTNIKEPSTRRPTSNITAFITHVSCAISGQENLPMNRYSQPRHHRLVTFARIYPFCLVIWRCLSLKPIVTFILCASIFSLRRKKSLILNMTKGWNK